MTQITKSDLDPRRALRGSSRLSIRARADDCATARRGIRRPIGEHPDPVATGEAASAATAKRDSPARWTRRSAPTPSAALASASAASSPPALPRGARLRLPSRCVGLVRYHRTNYQMQIHGVPARPTRGSGRCRRSARGKRFAMKLGPLILAVLTAGAVGARWRRLPARTRALAAAFAIACAVWGSGLIHPPNLETISRDVGATLGSYTYAVVGVLAFLETGAGVGLIVPGELAVVIGGVTSGQGHTELLLLIAIVWACAVAGDVTSYVLGRRLGREFLLRHGAALKLTEQRLEQVETFLRRHGGKTIVVGRFIGLVRALAPFAAGSMNMRARRFLPAVFVAAGLWAASFATLGYVSGGPSTRPPRSPSRGRSLWLRS